MANEAKVHEVCELLIGAFPNFSLTKATIAAYALALADVGEAELQAAAVECIRARKFFPSASELLAEARRQCELARGGMRLGSETDPLAVRRFNLEEAAWQSGELDAAEWEQLAKEFDLAGRVCGAASIRAKAEKIGAELAVPA